MTSAAADIHYPKTDEKYPLTYKFTYNINLVKDQSTSKDSPT